MTTTPRHLGKYELQKLLGHGGSGEVWLGYNLQQRQNVAIKLLHPDLLQSDPHFITHFMKEWQAIIALHHPNIVQVREVNVTRSNETRVTTPYIIMDYIAGHTTLADFIQHTSRVGRFPSIADIVHIFTSLGAAIDYAHKQELFHNDIKPTNVLLDTRNMQQSSSGEPMLTDFGIGNLPSSDTSAFSPLYLSPEQVKGQTVNSRSDIYALGVMLYEMCTGALPFHGESNVAIMMHHINTPPTPPILINTNIPPTLSEVILRAMAKNPNTRFATASLLAIAIADACAQNPHVTLNKNQANAKADEPFYYHSTGPLPHIINPQPQRTNRTIPIFGLSSEPSQPIPSDRAISPSPALPEQGTSKFPVEKQTLLTSPSPSTGQIPSLSLQTTPILPALSDTSRRITAVSSASSPKLLAPPTVPAWQRRRTRATSLSPLALIIISLVLLLVVIGSLAISFLLHAPAAALPKATVGHVFFQDDALGHDDTLRLTMQGITPPPTGKRFVTWLQNTTGQAIPLGILNVQNGSASLTYTDTAHHSNLLASIQAIIVTLENNGQTLPATYTNNAKVYVASFSSAALPYIQHILSHLPGFPDHSSLSTELLNALQGINDKAGSIADSLQGKPDDALAIRQATRIIEMIDGTQYARVNGDLPPALPNMLTLPVGLLSSSTQQGYIDTLAAQVDALKQVSTNNTDLLQHIQNVDYALADLRNWVAKMRSYDVQILTASNLSDPTIINAALQLQQLAQYAYTGRTIPPNDSPLPIIGSAGAFQAYAECQYLATMDIKKM